MNRYEQSALSSYSVTVTKKTYIEYLNIFVETPKLFFIPDLSPT